MLRSETVVGRSSITTQMSLLENRAQLEQFLAKEWKCGFNISGFSIKRWPSHQQRVRLSSLLSRKRHSCPKDSRKPLNNVTEAQSDISLCAHGDGSFFRLGPLGTTTDSKHGFPFMLVSFISIHAAVSARAGEELLPFAAPGSHQGMGI